MQDSLAAAAFEYHLDYLVTLTLPGTCPLDDQIETLKRAFSRFILEARRTFPAPLHYWWCYGHHRTGALHLHMLVNHDLRRTTHYRHRAEWLKRTWHRLAVAHQAKLSPITPATHQQVIAYLLTNLMGVVQKGLPVGRRYGGSRAIKVRHRGARDPEALPYRHLRGTSASLARLTGIELDPITNGDFTLDAAASLDPMATPPLCRSAATAPAERRGLAVPPCPPVPNE